MWAGCVGWLKVVFDLLCPPHILKQVSETTKIVRSARSSLVAADTAATADPTRIPTLATRQRNCMQLHETLLAIQRVVQGRQAIAALLEAEDYFNAMELISAAKKVYHEQLSGIVALRQLGNQVSCVVSCFWLYWVYDCAQFPVD